MLRFYFRVLRRFPGVFLNAASIVGSLILLAAAAALYFKGQALANDILGLHGFSPVWAVVPCALIVAYGLARSNYQEALRLGATNRMNPSPSPINIENATIILGGTNSALSPELLEALRRSGTQTETESGPGPR